MGGSVVLFGELTGAVSSRKGLFVTALSTEPEDFVVQ
jgi:hypothetical protein